MEGQVTFLTDLPELDALEHQHIQNHPQGNQHIQQGYQKFIRNNGGRPGSDGTYRTMSGMKPRMQENFQSPATTWAPRSKHIAHEESRPVSCRDVYLHVAQCPVCRAYYNRDNTTLYIILVSLIIVVLFLLKKQYDDCFSKKSSSSS
jgi:hypothetical protein